MSLFDDLIKDETETSVREKIVGFAQGAGLKLTNWLTGSVGEQILATVVKIVHASSRAMTAFVRGFASLDTSTDPGDEDPFDATNIDATPEAGLLSALGENTFGTVRGGETFASGEVTFVNAGPGARTFAPESLTWTWTEGTPPSPAPTYRNAPDPAIYTNPDGTVTVLAGAELVIPVVAEEAGTRSNAPAGALTLTTSLLGVTATNDAAILGADREDADVYRARCRQAAARVSLAGPVGIYEYLAAKNLDGTPLLNADDAEVAITRVYVTEESAVGAVDVYYADDGGAPLAADVTAANDNITTYALATPGAITFTGAAATEVPVPIVGTGKIKRVAGMSDAALALAAEGAIVDALTAAFSDFPIGGFDQTDGAGVIYTTDLRAIAADAYPGLYNVLVSTPAAASTALALGEVAVPVTTVADWTVTVVP